jgi:hypothetical protein
MRHSLVAFALALVGPRLAAADANHCEITVTGDATAAIKADSADTRRGKLTAGTDYWMSEAQLRSALTTVAAMGKLSKPDQARKVDEAMQRDPRFMLLIINCLTDDGGVIITAAPGTRYASVPFQSASYAIAPSGKSRPGDFTAMVHLKPDGKREPYAVSEPGKLVLSQFDGQAIAGTFTFKADSRGKTRKQATFAGSFHFACSGQACK